MVHGGEPETDIVSVILVARATGHDLEEKVAEYTAKAARAGGPGDASLGMLWHKLSELPVVTIAKIRGRGRRDAPRRGRRAAPGPAAGTGRALEAILGADDFDAETAERYGWVNRALPDADLDTFVARLARRIASYPADAVRTAKRVLNELTMPGPAAIRADARRFHQLVISDAAQDRAAALFAQGLQTRGPLELDLGDRLGAL